jgi:hypothetical protein
MEVNDRPNEMEVAGANTTKAFMANKFTITMVIYRNRFIFYLKMSLNSGGNIAHCLYLFFNEHEDRVKTARILRLFFNEHELYAKTARCTS